MGATSWIHWLIVLGFLALVIFPITKILARAGLSRWWALLAFFPLLNLIGLWALAFAPWPALRRSDRAAANFE